VAGNVITMNLITHYARRSFRSLRSTMERASTAYSRKSACFGMVSELDLGLGRYLGGDNRWQIRAGP
jgi:hypothetical protein